MSSFEALFRKSKGQPIDHNGKTIQLFDRMKLNEGQKVKVTFESVNSDWRQGVLVTTEGAFEVNDQTAEQSVVLWQDTAPRQVILGVNSKIGEITVINVWDTGNGLMHQCHNGAGMIVEEILAGKRYKCNDGVADDDFDDLVFRVELVG